MIRKYRLLSLGMVVITLWLLALACAQSGKILTPAEATASAAPTAAPTVEAAEGLEVGSTAYLVGKSYLVSLMDGPDSKKMIAGQERGAEVTILNVTSVDGVLWYQIEAPTGKGWVPADNLTAEAP